MASENLRCLESPDFYTIGWIAALFIERAAAEAMLDEEHGTPKGFQRPPNDPNSYTWGSIGGHNIVISSLEEGVYGLASAAATAIRMTSTLPSIRFGLLVGIGGGIPRPDDDRDIRLGDVVVSRPDGTTGGILQYDLVKATLDSRPKRKGFLVPPPHVLLNSLTKIQAAHERKGSKVPSILKCMLEENAAMAKQTKKKAGYIHQGSTNDHLFLSSYEHCSGKDCSSCEGAQEVQRDERDSADPEFHYGIIASGNTLVKNGVFRDQLVADAGEDCLCVEMEAAGLMNHFPCLVIRGICDYADSHKNDRWQRYASATAAAYAKELLDYVPPADVQETKRVSDIISSFERTALATKAAVDSLKSDSHRQRIRKWLGAPDPNSNFNHARELQHKGTGSWLLESETFQSWVAGVHKHLWLRGMPGCGKTVLSSTVIDHLTKMNNKPVLSFFFDFGDTSKQTKSDLLRSMAFQLYRKGLDFRGRVDDLFRQHQDEDVRPTTRVLESLIDGVIASSEGFCIVLDALDESTSTDEVLAWIRKMYKVDHIQMIYTSREVADFIDSLPEFIGRQCCLLMDQEAIDADIHSYVKRTLERDDRFVRKRLPQGLKDNIQNEVGNEAKGMFRWAACQLDTLASCVSPRELERDLNRLPRDLAETYERMLERIPQSFKSDAIRLLQFIVYAGNPPTLQEAIEIIATYIDEDPPHFYTDCRLFSSNEILQHCTSLVSVVEVESYDGVRQEIHLAHFSVKEYLSNRSGFDHVTASIAITKTCLTYLSDIKGHRWNLAQKFPLVEYAAKTWFELASTAEASEDVSASIVKFLQANETFQWWWHFCLRFDHYEGFDWGREYDCPLRRSLHYACLGGLTVTTRSILAQGGDVNARRPGWLSPLNAAIRSGNPATVEIILDKNPDFDTGKDSHRPLVVASGCGDPLVFELLLQRNEDVIARDGAGDALQTACCCGHKKIAELLLKRNADVYTQGTYGDALSLACTHGYKEIVEMLLKRTANINTQGTYGTAIGGACAGGHREIVKLLLNNNANVHLRSGEFPNALAAAASGGDVDIVRLLLDAGIDFNIGSYHTGSALQVASREGHLDIVQLLLQAGADINAQGIYYCKSICALTEASLFNHVNVVKLLLTNGANVRVKVATDGTPLQAASYFGNEEIVEMLLSLQVDVNEEGGKDGSALQVACIRGGKGQERVVKMLLDRGANVNAQGGKYGNALLAACYHGHRNIIEILMEYGADLNTLHVVENHFNLLSLARREGYIDFIKILEDFGVHIDVPQDTLDELLMDASFSHNIDSVKLLLELGANVNAQGCWEFNSALCAACRGGGDRKDTILFLLESGADINLGGECSTALRWAAVEAEEILMEMLLDLKADANAPGPGSDNAILAASDRGNGTIVRILLENGARTETVGNDGRTPLCAASSKGHDYIVKMLIESGADTNYAGKCGHLPLLTALANGHIGVVNLLLRGGATTSTTGEDGWTSLMAASIGGNAEVASQLLDEYGVDPDHRHSKYGRTALSCAAEAGQQAVVELLLADLRVDPHSKDSIDRTPLSFASQVGHDAIVNSLLRRGAPVNQSDRYYSTPLSMAARRGHTKVVESLLAAGATIDSQDCFRKTPLWWARRRSHTEIVQLLLDAANHQGISLSGEAVPEVDTRLHDPSHTYCDICTFGFPGDSGYYHCPVCKYGDFDICIDCFELGGHCLEESHELRFNAIEEPAGRLSGEDKSDEDMETG